MGARTLPQKLKINNFAQIIQIAKAERELGWSERSKLLSRGCLFIFCRRRVNEEEEFKKIQKLS